MVKEEKKKKIVVHQFKRKLRFTLRNKTNDTF